MLTIVGGSLRLGLNGWGEEEGELGDGLGRGPGDNVGGAGEAGGRVGVDVGVAVGGDGVAGFDEVYRGQHFLRRALRPDQVDRAGDRGFDFGAGRDFVRVVADIGRGGAEGDHGDAKACAVAHRAAADLVF